MVQITINMDIIEIVKKYANEIKKKYEIEAVYLFGSYAKKYNLSCVWLFGSYAKKKQTKDSDIDILVRTEDVVGGSDNLYSIKMVYIMLLYKYMQSINKR